MQKLLDELTQLFKWASFAPFFKSIIDKIRGLQWAKIFEKDEDIPNWRKDVYQNKTD
ncbi:MAG: hypothetical protein ACWGQW_00125 [bacterium]